MKKLLATLGLYDKHIFRLEELLRQEESFSRNFEPIRRSREHRIRTINRAIELHRQGKKIAHELDVLAYLLKERITPSDTATASHPDVS